MNYWTATLRDGKTVTEQTSRWRDIKDSIGELRFIYHGVTYAFPAGMPEYVQGKTASASLAGGDIKIESHWVGFRSPTGQVIKLRFYEGQDRVELKTE